VRDFVAILKNDHAKTNSKHWFICTDCYEADLWQTRISRKVAASYKPAKPIAKSVNADTWESALKEVIAKDDVPW
jgi:hypothetical protein